MFFNMLVLSFARQAPGRLFLVGPSDDALKSAAGCRENFDEAQQCIDWYFGVSGDLGHRDYWSVISGLWNFIDDGIEQGGLDEDFKATCIGVELLDTWNALFAMVQARLPNLKIEGRGIRADLFVFVPSKPDFRVVVECDGFAFHTSKQRFVTDRKRDRLLRSNGFDVLRYSGSEIFADAIAAATDLSEYLLARKPPDYDRCARDDSPSGAS
jgi:very-short-patch-repair endonuclease